MFEDADLTPTDQEVEGWLALALMQHSTKGLRCNHQFTVVHHNCVRLEGHSGPHMYWTKHSNRWMRTSRGAEVQAKLLEEQE